MPVEGASVSQIPALIKCPVWPGWQFAVLVLHTVAEKVRRRLYDSNGMPAFLSVDEYSRASSSHEQISGEYMSLLLDLLG